MQTDYKFAKTAISYCPPQYASEKCTVKHYYWLYMMFSLTIRDFFAHKRL